MAPRKSKPKKTQNRKQEQIFEVTRAADFLMQIPEISEAFTQADIELALDDRGWLVGGKKMAGELDPLSRTVQINKSRYYWLRDPLVHQAVRLWTDYGLGDTGISYHTDDPGVQKKLDKFMKDRRNRRLLSTHGMRRLSNRLLVDGDLFFAIFDDGTIRTFDPLQITDIVSDPDDDETPLCYRRKTANDKVLYYVDWAIADDSNLKALAQKQKDPETHKPITLETNVKMYHMPFDAFEKRGNGLFCSAVNWSREHRRFMEARVALTQALAKFAWKGDVKGGQSMLTAIQKRLQSTFVDSGLSAGTERNPQNAPGGTWLQNQGIDLTAMPRNTGAGDARNDADQLKLQVCAGTGIFLHYFGDPSTGNLATATAMELPMLKMFAAYQKLWKDTFRDIFTIVLDESPDDDPAEIVIDCPPILADDLQKLGSFISSAATVFPELKVDPVLKIFLTSLGIEDIDEVMEQIEAKREELQAEQEQQRNDQMKVAMTAAKTGGNKPKPADASGNPAQQNTESADPIAAKLDRLIELLS
jgi:hypothetical protein